MQRPYATIELETDGYVGDANAVSDASRVRLDAPPYEAAFDTDEFVQIPVVAARAIDQQYAAVGQYSELLDADDDREYVTLRKPADELRDAAWSLENAPMTLGHPDSKVVTGVDDVRGFVRGVEWDSDDEALVGTVYVPANDNEALEWVADHDHVSVGFFFDIDSETTGVDGAQRNLLFDHLAVVDQGRCSREDGCGLGMDSMIQADAADSIHVSTDAIRTGSWVQWDWSGGTAYGKVVDVITEAGETVSAAGNEREATDERNAYKLRSWEEESESWGSPVVKLEGENNLRMWDDPPTNAPSLDADGCTDGPCSCGRHTSVSDAVIDATVGGEEINLTPPEAVQNNAQRVLDWRADDEKDVAGMTDHGWSRAEQLAAGDALSPSDIVSGTGAMAPWWSRHASHTLVDTDDGYSLDRERDTEPHKDNSYVAGLGWGGVAGYRWAIRKGNEIHRARGKEEPYSLDSKHTQASSRQKTVAGVSFMDMMGGELDESEIPSEGFAAHYLEAGDTKSDSAYPVVDADGNLRRGNVDAAFQLYGHSDDETALLDALEQLNDEFDDPPIDTDALKEAQTANDTIVKQQTAIDMADTTITVGVDDDVVETLRDEFDEVAELVAEADELDERLEAAQDRIDELEGELEEYRLDDKRELVDEITDYTDYWGEDELLEADLDTLEERLEIVETTATDSSVSTPEGGEGTRTETDDADDESDASEYSFGETYDLSNTA